MGCFSCVTCRWRRRSSRGCFSWNPAASSRRWPSGTAWAGTHKQWSVSPFLFEELKIPCPLLGINQHTSSPAALLCVARWMAAPAAPSCRRRWQPEQRSHAAQNYFMLIYMATTCEKKRRRRGRSTGLRACPRSGEPWPAAGLLPPWPWSSSRMIWQTKGLPTKRNGWTPFSFHRKF